MMVNFDFLSEPIRFDEMKINVLCVENQRLFRRVCDSLINDRTEENKIVFSENYQPYKAKGNVCVIFDYFRLSYSSSVMKKMYEQTEKLCVRELQTETLQLKTHIVKFMESVVQAYDFDFDFNYEINIVDLFKSVDFKPHIENRDVLNVLSDYILILNKYVPQKLFILLNLHLYFSKEELEMFYKDIINNHINLLVIENKMSFNRCLYETLIVYDNDFCEIIEN